MRAVLVVAAAAILAGCGNDFDALFKDGGAEGGGIGSDADGAGRDASAAGPDGGCDAGTGDCTCDPGGVCDQTCRTGSCAYACADCNGSFRCNDKTDCTLDCTGSATCAATCDETKSCSMSCTSDAQCILDCRSSPDCALDCNGGNKRSCPNNVFTCNTPCP